MQPSEGYLGQGSGSVILISGATGFLGRALAVALMRRNHVVRALVRPGSESKAPGGSEVALGDALDAGSVCGVARGCGTLCHLVGTPHPASWKQREFEQVDRASLFASVQAAQAAGIRHLVYVSVAHPAPMMRGYIAIRRECEARIDDCGIPATILRPWYVLGPGHRWPIVLQPFYQLAEAVPLTREAAARLGLVTHAQMIGALVWATENPPEGRRVLSVPEIRTIGAAGFAGADSGEEGR